MEKNLSKNERICASCGKTINKEEYGLNKSCPYCNQVSATANIKGLHILFDTLYYPNIGTFVKIGDLGIDYESVLLNYMLTVGDISNPPFSNEGVYIHNRYRVASEIDEQIKKQLDKINNTPSNIPVYLWYDWREPNEVLNLFYFAPMIYERFKKVYLVRIKSLPTLRNKEKLNEEDIYEMKQTFLECQKQGSYVRAIKTEGIANYTAEEFESIILSEINDEYQGLGTLGISIRSNSPKKYGIFPEHEDIRETLYRLSQKGTIESDGFYALWNAPGKRCALKDKKFRLTQTKKENLTFNDVLNALKDAIAYGATYLIYNSLAENIVLDCQGNEIIGRDNVISYIEKRGIEHFYIEKEKIRGSKIKINYENEAQDGVLIIYEGKDYKNPFVITVDYDGKQISKIYVEYLYHKKGILNIDLNDD